MKMLSENEINKLCQESLQTAHDFIKKAEIGRSVKPSNLRHSFESQINPASISLLLKLLCKNSFSERTLHQLLKTNFADPRSKENAIQILSREIYLDKRISMDCSRSEGTGISPSLDGLYGEKLTVFELELCIFYGYKGHILHNLEIEIGNRTVQIDVLFITKKGIFVIESKNYSGSISGAEYLDKWTIRTPNKNYQFYNPITQNQTHINVLSRFFSRIRFFSLIAFSERCDLEYIDIHKRDVFVFNRYALKNVICDVFANEPDILSESELNSITDLLRQYCADEPSCNPHYKEPRGYYSANTKATEHPNASYQRRRTMKYGSFLKELGFYFNDGHDDFDDYDDFDDDDFDDY